MCRITYLSDDCILNWEARAFVLNMQEAKLTIEKYFIKIKAKI